MIYLSIGGSVTNELRYVRKTLLDWNFCRTGTLNADEVDETMLCAGESGIDACQVCFSFWKGFYCEMRKKDKKQTKKTSNMIQ